jgi:hypothetical protein
MLFSSCLLILGGCHTRSPIERIFGSRRNWEVIREPSHVEISRLQQPHRNGTNWTNYGTWPAALGPVTLDGAQVSEISALLLNERTYCNWDEGKGHQHRPEIKVRFSNEDNCVDVVFCLTCNMLFTYEGSRAVWGGNYDYCHNTFVAYFAKIFPSDPALPELLLPKSR